MGKTLAFIAILIIGLFAGFILGAFVSVGSADKIIKIYAAHSRLYYCDDHVYEIKELTK